MSSNYQQDKIGFVEIKFRFAEEGDLKKYTNLLQRTYQDAYTNKTLGLTKDLFSKEIFNSLDTQKYLAGNLRNTNKQKTWLAFDGPRLVGSVTISDGGEECEMRGFYVKTDYQGMGIGKKLWKLVLDFVKGKDITLDIYAHNIKTIEIYKRWGFEIDKEKGEFYRHWPEWPEEIKAKSIYMRYSK